MRARTRPKPSPRACVWLLATLLLTPGCYLGHVAVGQLDLLRSREPIVHVLSDPETPPDVRTALERVLEARSFAAELGLDVDEQYTHYAAWPGDRLVTTVVATRPGELVPAGFWFPIVGQVPYKGFFTPEQAEAEAQALRDEGYDVCLSGVRAYSTLGWFADPITGPMLRQGEGRLVETVIHELVHASVFAPSHADFNESVATFIGEEAAIRFFASHAAPPRAAREQRRVEIARRYRAILESLRDELEGLYERTPAGPERTTRRQAILTGGRERIAAIPGLADPEATAVQARLNDACLALSSTYGAEIDRYARMLEVDGLDLEAFIARAREAAAGDDPVQALLGSPPGDAGLDTGDPPG